MLGEPANNESSAQCSSDVPPKPQTCKHPLVAPWRKTTAAELLSPQWEVPAVGPLFPFTPGGLAAVLVLISVTHLKKVWQIVQGLGTTPQACSWD